MSDGSGLFGRGLLYVVVLSTQVLASTLVSPILAHSLPPEEFGALASAIALFQVLSALAVLGMDRVITVRRSIDEDSAGSRQLLTISFLLSTGVSVLAFASMLWWAPAVGFGDRYALAVAVVLWTLPGAFVQCSSALLLSEDRIGWFAAVTLVSSVVGPVVGLGLIFSFGRNASVYAIGGVIAQFAAAILAAIITRPSLGKDASRGAPLAALRLGLPLTASGLAYFVLNAGDRLIILRELGPAAVGRYQVAYVVGSTVLLLLGFLNLAWSPRIVAVRDRTKRTMLSVRARDALYALLMPIIAGVSLGAPVALRVVAPESYEPSSLLPLVFIVALSAFPIVASGATGRMLLADSRGGILAIAAAVSATINVVLNLCLIPFVGLLGSAIATFVAFFALAGIQRAAIGPRTMWPGPPRRLVGLAAGVTALSALSLLPTQDVLLNTIRFVGALVSVVWLVIVFRRVRKDV